MIFSKALKYFVTKSKIVLPVVFFVMLLLCFSSVFAENSTEAVYDESAQQIIFCGKAEPDRSLYVNDITIKVLKPGIESGDNNEYENALFFIQIEPDARGNFRYAMDASGIRGIYNVCFTFANGEKEYKRLSVIGDAEKEKIYKEFNQTDNMGEFLEKYSEILGESLFENFIDQEHKEEMTEYLSQKNVSSFDELCDLKKRTELICALYSYENNMRHKIAEEYVGLYFNGNKDAFANLYAEIDDNDKEKSFEMLKGAEDIDKADDLIIESLIVYSVNRAESKTELSFKLNSGKMLSDYIKECVRGVNTKLYDSLSKQGKNTVLNELVLNKPYTSVYELKERFNAASAKAAEVEESSNSGGVSSSGSAGGSSGGGRTLTVETNSDFNSENEEVTENNRVEFIDIDDLTWAKEYIIMLRNRGIINGRGANRFAPNENITRAELAKIVAVAADVYDKNAKYSFDDVYNNMWYYSYVASAALNNLINGTGENMFMPDEFITRQDIAAVVYRAYEDYLSLNVGKTKPYDMDAVSDYAREAVEILFSNGIICGDENGNYNPAQYVTRAETAKILGKLIELKENTNK